MTTTPQDTPEVTPDALREWNHHVECVMRGLAHALNNRAAALSAVIELSREPDDDPAATREVLEGEMERVAELVRVVRILATPRGEPEALAPADLVRDLKSILHLHADLRDRAAEFATSNAAPVRVHRWMLLRALVALAATTTARPDERTFTVTLATEGEWLTARANAPQSVYMGELARAMGGEPNPDGSGFRIPTLESVRRREAR
jgi:hypothetical protein